MHTTEQAADGGSEHDHGDTDAPSPTCPPKLQAPPKSAVVWDKCVITPGLIRALGLAQAAARTVDKRGRNEGTDARGDRAARKGYDYATAEDMIAEARRCLATVGGDDGVLWWTCAVRAVDPPTFDLGPNQWPCSLIVTESIVHHVAADGSIGRWLTTAECLSIGSSGRPPDKADKAAETYLRGFLARDLLQLDRGAVAAVDDVDKRVDADADGGTGRVVVDSAPASELSAVKDATNGGLRKLIEAIGASGKPKPTIRNLTIDLLGRAPSSIADWRSLQSIVDARLGDFDR